MSAHPMGPADVHHHDPLTDPLARLSAALVLSLLLWAPFGMAVLRNDLDVVQAGLRYLVAFVGSRLAVGGIAHLLASYRDLQHAAPLDLDAAPDAHDGTTGPLQRRATDAA